MLGLHTSLPFEIRPRPALVIDAWVSFTYEPYEPARPEGGSYFAVNPPEDITDPREDHIWQVGAAVEHPVTDRVSLVFQYNFVDTGSSVVAYDYDRHIVGGLVQVNLW